MAKLSSIHRNLRRQQKSAKAATKRAALRQLIKKQSGSVEQEASVMKLQKAARDESPVRVRNRCRECGRPAGTLRKFGLCRIHLREAAMRGDVPGLRKASW